jgi:DNA transformation protein
MADEIAALRNLGPKSQAMLAKAGIMTLEDLRRLRAVAAYAKVKATGVNASLNLLWALEGALSGQPWQIVAKEHRTSLLLALDSHQQQDNARC